MWLDDCEPMSNHSYEVIHCHQYTLSNGYPLYFFHLKSNRKLCYLKKQRQYRAVVHLSDVHCVSLTSSLYIPILFTAVDDGSLDSVLGDGIQHQNLSENGVYQELSFQAKFAAGGQKDSSEDIQDYFENAKV